MIGLVHYSWSHLLSTLTNKSYSQANSQVKCLLPRCMSRCHFMEHQDQPLACWSLFWPTAQNTRIQWVIQLLQLQDRCRHMVIQNCQELLQLDSLWQSRSSEDLSFYFEKHPRPEKLCCYSKIYAFLPDQSWECFYGLFACFFKQVSFISGCIATDGESPYRTPQVSLVLCWKYEQ